MSALCLNAEEIFLALDKREDGYEKSKWTSNSSAFDSNHRAL